MMLAMLFYAYGIGMRSSRRIEAACRSDAAFRVICGNVTPDHATIARFLVDHEAAIEASFVDVLRLCAAAGLVSVGTIAIDGTKIAADAALDKNRGAEWIRTEVARIVGEAVATDSAEDNAHGLFGLDQLPPALSTRKGRLARLEAALERIEAEDEAAKAYAEGRAAKAREAATTGRKLRGREPKDPHAALARAEAEHCRAHSGRRDQRRTPSQSRSCRRNGPQAAGSPPRRRRQCRAGCGCARSRPGRRRGRPAR